MPHALPQVCLASSANVGPGTLNRLASDAIITSRHPTGERSAIDVAFDSLLVVTQVTVDVSSKWKTEHGLILSSSAVAAAEDYFRSILTAVVGVCELCATRVKPLETRMEFVFNGSVEDAVRGMLELESLSSRDKVISWSKTIAGADLRSEHSLDVALREFERVCHVRHAAMHAGGYVSSRNAAVLGVEPGTWIAFSSAQAIHEIIAVVTATLRAYNQTLFEKVLGRWLNEGVLSGDWSADRTRFEPLWNTFRSEVDINGRQANPAGNLRSNAYQAYRSVQKALVARTSALA